MRNFTSSKAGSNFRKLDRMNDNDPEDVVMLGQGAQCDSDSDFDPKDKNARTKISRVGTNTGGDGIRVKCNVVLIDQKVVYGLIVFGQFSGEQNK